MVASYTPYTSTATTGTTAGTAGYVSGMQYGPVTLQYVGSGMFLVTNFSGNLVVH